MKTTCGIYALIDPRTDRVMYVGQSIDIDYRFRQHLDGWRHDSNRRKVQWIGELQRIGMLPILKIIEECPFGDCDTAEIRWIRHYKVMGQCEFNRALGGSAWGSSRLLNGHPDDWFQLGLKVRRAENFLWDIRRDACSLAGARGDTAIKRACDSLLKAKSTLDRILHGAFPEWTQLAGIFFGTEVEDTAELTVQGSHLPGVSCSTRIVGHPTPSGPLALK
jgi:hypothetical protein